VKNTLLKIIDNPLTALFSSIEKIKLFGLLNCDKFDAHGLKCNFADHLVHKLIRLYDEFDRVLLKNSSEYLREKFPYELLQRLQGSKRATTFVRIYRLANRTSTIPATTASVGQFLNPQEN
jgi:hypothetical protein